MLVFLLTDILLWLLVFIIIVLIVLARNKAQFQIIVKAIKSSKLGMMTLVILISYTSIALLDSIHYKPIFKYSSNGSAIYSPVLKSVLDDILTPWDKLSEKTYSAPFANHLFSKETITLKDGRQARIYPKLKYIRTLPFAEKGKAVNVTFLILYGVGKAFLIFIILFLLWCFYFCLRFKVGLSMHVKNFLTGNYLTKWPIFWFSILIIFSLISVVGELSQYFHVLGTDKVGDDVFYAAIKSIRTAIIIGTITSLFLLPIAILFGVISGFFSGIVDDIVQYIYTTLNSIPGVLLIAAMALLLNLFMANHANLFSTITERADTRLLALCFILGITSWTGLCRLLRAETMKVRELDYILAARAMGVNDTGIIVRHILPNITYLIIIAVALDFSGLVLAESILSYVGVGVDPTMFSWGNMINSARLELSRDPVVWWPLVAAFGFMFILVLAANLFADVVRDALDPHLRN